MNIKKDNFLIIIAGPTAVGKTSIAIEIAKRFNAEIFSCDSRQLYKEMSIGTAKPTSEELLQVKHHFVDAISIHEHYTAGDFERDMDNALQLYYKHKNIAILTGGTGLYIKAAVEGLDSFPDVNDTIIQSLQRKLQSEGLEILIEQLKILDEVTYNSIDLQNSRRVIRALSVCLAEGKPYSSYLGKKKVTKTFKPVYICLERDREELYNRINRRVEAMLQNGLEKEVKELYPHRSLKALHTVGYAELFDFFDGNISKNEAIELIKRNTRRYAKRQMTWFRNQGHYSFFSPNDSAEIMSYITTMLERL